MPIDILRAEALLLSNPKLRQIYSQKYELSFESNGAKQIAINRRARGKVGVWIENHIDPRRLGLSGSTTFEHYPPTRPRAHLSASRLTGPYKSKNSPGRIGNDCWYVRLCEELDFRALLDAYL
jgi:hypothetical protein